MDSKELTISIIHINDHHSHLEADSTMTVNLGGSPTKIHLGGMAEVSYKINELRKKDKNHIVLHGGDAMTGTLYFTLFNGIADAYVMNEIGFDAFTLGNHEFDLKDKGLKKFLDILNTPVVCANVIANKESILYNYWKPYIIKNIEGEKIAIIGLDIVNKTKNASSPSNQIKFIDEIKATQDTVKELEQKGINKIILLSHAGTKKNFEIAKKVSGIDIIISADTHSLFANNDLKNRGFLVRYNYPEMVKSPKNELVYIVEGWEYSKFVGNLIVTFDKNGVIKEVKSNPSILIKDNFFERKDKEGKFYQVVGLEKNEILDDIKNSKILEISQVDPNVEKIIEKYKKEKDILASQKIGSIVGLVMSGGALNRIPNRIGANPNGSVATRFISEIMLEEIRSMGNKIDFTIQNAGNTRTDILPGDITYNDVYTYMPFGNTLFLIDIKGSEIKEMLEEAINYSLKGGLTGAFPYGAGIKYEAIGNFPFGNRVKKIEIYNYLTYKWELLNLDKMYRMGTNSYIANGKDGYTILGKISNDISRNPYDTYLPDAESFIKFMKKNPNFKSYTDSNVKFSFN